MLPCTTGGLIHDANSVKLMKGSYKVKALLRHPERGQLESVKDLPMLLSMPLGKVSWWRVRVEGRRSRVQGSGFRVEMTG